MGIRVIVSAYEADGQVVKHALLSNVMPISGDSDLLAIGRGTEKLQKLMVVKSWFTPSYRIIDLTGQSTNGELPLFDLYVKHGRIVFQLYAACRGCDFTEQENGIPEIGFKTFIDLMSRVVGAPSPASFAAVIWAELREKAMSIQLTSEEDVCKYLQNIVDIYSNPKIYDDSSNIIFFDGAVDKESTLSFNLHKAGVYNSRTALPFLPEEANLIKTMDCSQLLVNTAAETSTIRGVNLPPGATPEECTVSALRDFLAARSGSITGNKPELVKAVKSHQFVEQEVSRRFVNRNYNKKDLFTSLLTQVVPNQLGDSNTFDQAL